MYVGVPNSKTKQALSRRPPYRTIYVDAKSLAWDCARHIAFLEWAERQEPDALVGSDYARWLLHTGHDAASVQEKCRRFLALFDAIRDGLRFPSWAIVTEDCLRLDGSHRAACAAAIGLGTLAVSVVRYRYTDTKWRREMIAIRDAKWKGVWSDE